MGVHAYKGVPLMEKSPAARGLILQSLVRVVDGLVHMNAHIVDATAGRCINGRARGARRAEYDWIRDGSRIECKSAQLSFDAKKRHWLFGFLNIKLGPCDTSAQSTFDELLLALYTPRGVYIYR